MKAKAGWFLLFLFGVVEPKTVTWRFDADISNPSNWIDGKPAKNCKGIHFAPSNDAHVFIGELTTPEITLPIDGELVILEDGFIEFRDNKKCIRLKEMNYHRWYDPDSWTSDSNSAVPDLERIPCTFDDVVFPKRIHTRIFEDYGVHTSVKSVKYGVQSINKGTVTSPDMNVNIFTANKACGDPLGCKCHPDYIPCPMVHPPEKPPCQDPIQPQGFCREICGAYVTLGLDSGFRLDDLEKRLEEYSADTHVSRVTNYLGGDAIQIVFSEKEFSGKSLEEAEDFFATLHTGRLEKSGRFYAEQSSDSALFIVFGTLVAVVMFFAVLLYANGDTKIDLLISRLHRGRDSVLQVPFFARFDNTDDNLVVLDGEPEAPKSFDNPMYGRDAPTTSTKSRHENPLYDVALENGQGDDGEEVEE